MLVLTAAEVEQALDVAAAVASQQLAFGSLGSQDAVTAPRFHLPGLEGALAFGTAARLAPGSGAVCKFGSFNPRNPERGLPTVSAVVTVLDPSDGRLVAVLDGGVITTLRTAAGSAVAAAALVPPGTGNMAVLGSGTQAIAHVRAISTVLPLQQTRMFSRNAANCQSAARQLDAELAHTVRAAGSAQEAVAGAQLVVAATTSATPVLDPAWLAPGATVISVGSFTPDRHEISAELLAAADAVVVDDVHTALEHAGPVIRAAADRRVSAERLIPLGALVCGTRTARRADSDLVVYISVGLGVQDAAAALAAVGSAKAQGIGRQIAL